MEYSSAQIEQILKSYKMKREREIKYYHEVKKFDEEYINKNRERAKKHYQNGYKEKKKEYYENNKDIMKAKSSYNYYKKIDKIDVFKEKHPDKYKLLVEKGLIEDNFVNIVSSA